MTPKWIKLLFLFAALYDLFFGLLFLLFHGSVYRMLELTLPNHVGYVQFGAALVTIFGIGFWFVYRDPLRNRDIIKMGVLLKLSYSSIVLGHQFLGTVPWIWIPFAWIDLAFAVGFLVALSALRSGPVPTEASR